MSKHLYAYGQHLLSSSKAKNQQAIHINQIERLPLDEFSYKVSFETNQERTIFLCTREKFENSNSLLEWIFVVESVVTFWCNSKTKQIYYQKDYNYTDKLMEYWLVHIVLPMYLSLDTTYYFLHAGSVVVENKAVLFVGDSFAGKSTLTEYFLRKNHPLLSDDKLATFNKDETFCCVGSHPYHRPYRKTEDLGIKAKNFYSDILKIGAVYWLSPVKADADVVIAELKGIKKFEVLRYSTEMDIYVNKKQRFEYITKLANSLKIYEIKVPHDLDRLEEVYTKILKHTKSREI